MAQEKSFGYETRKYSLVDRRRVLVYCAADFDRRIDQLLWRPALRDQTVSLRADPELLLLGRRCEVDAQLADTLSVC